MNKTGNYILLSNGLLLMLIALVPFLTKTLGQFLLTGAFKTAVVFYTGYFGLISIVFRLLWHAASRHPELLIPHLSARDIKIVTRNENIGLISNFGIMMVCLVGIVTYRDIDRILLYVQYRCLYQQAWEPKLNS